MGPFTAPSCTQTDNDILSVMHQANHLLGMWFSMMLEGQCPLRYRTGPH
jgi:hypothetical protein